MTTTTRAKYNGVPLRHAPAVFRFEANARSFAERTRDWLVMGECGEWLVVCPADAARLERAGYEMAR